MKMETESDVKRLVVLVLTILVKVWIFMLLWNWLIARVIFSALPAITYVQAFVILLAASLLVEDN